MLDWSAEDHPENTERRCFQNMDDLSKWDENTELKKQIINIVPYCIKIGTFSHMSIFQLECKIVF